MATPSKSFVAVFLGSALFLSIAGQAHAGANLVHNGTFGTGDFNGWSYTSSGGSAAVIVSVTDTLTVGSPDLSSGNGVYFTTDTGNQTLSQSIVLGQGLYSIGFDLLVPSSGYANHYDATFTASLAGTPLFSSASVHAIGSADGTNTWVNVDGLADITTAGTYSVSFTFAGGGTPAADVVVDRVYVTQGDVLPEPATIALITGPMFGLAALRRRRKAVAAV